MRVKTVAVSVDNAGNHDILRRVFHGIGAVAQRHRKVEIAVNVRTLPIAGSIEDAEIQRDRIDGERLGAEIVGERRRPRVPRALSDVYVRGEERAVSARRAGGLESGGVPAESDRARDAVNAGDVQRDAVRLFVRERRREIRRVDERRSRGEKRRNRDAFFHDAFCQL